MKGIKNMIIKILGGGCSRCKQLENNVITALQQANMTAEIVKISNPMDIADYGVMKTPALVIEEKVVSFGTVLSVNEIIDELTNF
jgi:small redox-active disulfide protein 2